MPKAIWNGHVIAETDTFEEVEGNVYFPPGSLVRDFFKESAHTSTCPWKGVAHYYDLVNGDQVNPAAAWYYPEPKPAASNIKGHIAFWRGVRVER